MKDKKLFNLKKSPQDVRDYAFAVEKPKVISLPEKIDLRKQMGVDTYNQLNIGSCTGNALAGAIQFFQKVKQMPSRLMIYNLARSIEDNLNCDCGAYIRDVVKMASKVGVVVEKDFPYKKSNLFILPSKDIQNKVFAKVGQYERISDGNLFTIKKALAEGLPVIGGMVVFEKAIQQAEGGVMPMPNIRDTEIGGHAILIVGYDDSKKSLLIRNSWGKRWGMEGHFWMPYDFAANPNYLWDCWVVKNLVK